MKKVKHNINIKRKVQVPKLVKNSINDCKLSKTKRLVLTKLLNFQGATTSSTLGNKCSTTGYRHNIRQDATSRAPRP